MSYSPELVTVVAQLDDPNSLVLVTTCRSSARFFFLQASTPAPKQYCILFAGMSPSEPWLVIQPNQDFDDYMALAQDLVYAVGKLARSPEPSQLSNKARSDVDQPQPGG